MSARRLSVGFVSPWPPARSGIADYSAELLRALAPHVDATAYPPEEAMRALAARHDVLLLQIGNDPMHAPAFEALTSSARTTPAVVTLHDFVLHHLFAAAYLDRGREEEYARALERAHGERGRALGNRALAGERVPVWDLDPWAFPMSAEVVRTADALVVHSRLAKGAVLRERPRAYVVEIPHHAVPAPRTPKDDARRALGLAPGRPVVATVGIVTPAKRVGKVLEALASLPRERRPFLLIGGSVGEGDPLVEDLTRLGLSGEVAFTGYLDEERFWLVASAADAAVNLRFPTMGETSGAVCRLAGFGLPVVVSDVGWFAELPDSFAAKVPVGEREIAALAGALETLGFDEAERERRSRAALAWGEERRPERAALLYTRVLQDVAEGRAGPL
ncbi:MAG TPA: glycosyltransferase family 4 protein, partial [Thermoanaerobaculia bacterium]|nr:glycosyltransferase family 4 protein [Thermoanaerobaculia bacterium]